MSASQLTRLGNEAFASVGQDNYEDGTDLIIVPGGDDPLGYAIYEVPGLVDERPVAIEFEASAATIAPGGSEELPLNFYIAVSDFSQYAWDTFGPFRKDPGTGQLPDPSEVLNNASRKDRYVNAAGSMFYAVLAVADANFASGGNPGGLSGVRVSSSTVKTLLVGADESYVMTKPLYTPLDVESAAQGGKGGSELDLSQFTTLRWTHYYDPADNNLSAIQYQIYRKDPGGVEKEIGSKNAPGAVFVDPTDVTGASIPPLVPGERYLYRLRAFNVNGFTGYSSAQVTVPLQAPTNVQATKNLTDDRIRVSWTKSDGATHYSVYEWISGEWTPRSGTLDDVDHWDWNPVGDHAPHTFALRAFRLRLADGGLSPSPFSASATGEVNFAPLACFTTNPDPPYGDPPLQVAFDATCSSDQDGTVVGYSWDFEGDGTEDDFLAQTNHTYAEPGSFDATLTVTDDLGATDTQVVDVRVGNPPIACFTADPEFGPAPLLVHFDATCSSDTDATDVITACDWGFDDGSAVGHGTTIDHTFSAGGRYTVELTVTDDEGLTDRTTLEVFVDTTPVACFDANVLEGAPPLSVDFDASCSEDPDGGAIVKYSWDIDYNAGTGFELEYESSIPTMTHQYTVSGTYQVVLRVEDNEGTQEDSSIATVLVNSPPTADLVATPNTGNQPLTVTLDASGSSDPEDGTNLQYKFDFGEGAGWEVNWGTESAPDNIYEDIGVYTARVKVKDQNGKESPVATATITVTNTPPVADLTATPDSGAPPLEVQFDASGSDDPDGYVTNYRWDFDGTGVGIAESPEEEAAEGNPTPTYTYDDPGSYTATVEVIDNDGDTDTTSVNIDVSDPRPEWWMFGRGAKHQHRSSFTGPATNAGKWTFTTGGIVFSSPAISANGVIYIGSENGKVYALNPDGSERWSYTTGAIVDSSPAIATDGTVYISSADAKLYAFNPNGTVKWSYVMGAASYSSPAIEEDGTIYVGCTDNKLYAINPNGTLKWAYTTGDQIEISSPAIGTDGTVYVGSFDDKLYAINSDGTLKWTYTTGGNVNSSPSIDNNGTIYVGSNDSKLHAVNPNGTMKWQYSAGNFAGSAAFGAGGTIYAADTSNMLFALNGDGTLQWSYAIGGAHYTSPAVDAAGTVYIGSQSQKIFAINANGTLKWSYATGLNVSSSPAIGPDGTVYAGSWDGKLYGIGPAWVKVPVGGTDPVTSRVLEVDGRPAVTYRSGFDLIYSHASSATPTAPGDWATHIVSNGTYRYGSGQHSFAIVGGLPMLSWYSIDGYDLSFAASGNSAPDDSADWMLHDAVATDICGEFSSLADFGGKPGVAFYDADTDMLRYARATVAQPDDGGDWVVGDVVSAGSKTDLSDFTQLLNVGGTPVILFIDCPSGDLYCATATSATPSGPGDWNIHGVDTAGSGLAWVAGAKVGGKPGVAYWDGVNSDIRYAYATVALPTANADWVRAMLFDGVAGGIVGLGMSVLNGVPVVAFDDWTGSRLAFATAATATPQGPWDWAMDTANAGGSNRWCNVSVLNGKPYITFLPSTGSGTLQLVYRP